MISRSRSCFASCSRRGLTLIEVTAGLLILSTLLVGILVAFQRHARQIEKAERTLTAIEAADALLGKWFTNTAAFPKQSSGDVAGDDSLSWETTLLNAATGELPDIQIVRLEIQDRASSDGKKPLAAVEVVLRQVAAAREEP